MNKSLNLLAMNLGSDAAQSIIVSAVRLGMDRDDIYTVLTSMNGDFIKPILLDLNDASITKAKIEVVTDKLQALRYRLNDAHSVNVCLIDRAAIQGRDWQTDMISGIVRTLYVAEDIVNEGNLNAFDRIVSAIVPFFFGERTTPMSTAKVVEEVPVKEEIPVATTAPEQAPIEEPVKEDPVKEEPTPDPAADIAAAVQNAVSKEAVKDVQAEAPKATRTIKTTKIEAKEAKVTATTTTRRRPAVKVIR